MGPTALQTLMDPNGALLGALLGSHSPDLAQGSHTSHSPPDGPNESLHESLHGPAGTLSPS